MIYVLLHTYRPVQTTANTLAPLSLCMEIKGVSYEPGLLLGEMNTHLDKLLKYHLNDGAEEVKQSISWGIQQPIFTLASVVPICQDGELFGYQHVIDLPGAAPLLVESYEVLAFRDSGEPRIYVEVWRGLLEGVYTDIPGCPQLIEITIGDANETQTDRDTLALVNKLVAESKIRKIDKSTNWILSDDSCCQCCRQITNRVYELIQVCRLPEEYGVARAVINVDEYSLDEWEQYLRLFGHKDLRDFIWDYDNDLNLRILAEYIFETDWLSHLLEDRFATEKEASAFISDIVDCHIDLDSISSEELEK